MSQDKTAAHNNHKENHKETAHNNPWQHYLGAKEFLGFYRKILLISGLMYALWIFILVRWGDPNFDYSIPQRTALSSFALISYAATYFSEKARRHAEFAAYCVAASILLFQVSLFHEKLGMTHFFASLLVVEAGCLLFKSRRYLVAFAVLNIIAWPYTLTIPHMENAGPFFTAILFILWLNIYSYDSRIALVESLARSVIKTQNVVTSAVDDILVVDNSLNVIWKSVSPLSVNKNRLDNAQLLAEAFPLNFVNCIQNAFAQNAIAQNRANSVMTLDFKRDGQTLYFEVRISSLEKKQWLLVIRDLTQQTNAKLAAEKVRDDLAVQFRQSYLGQVTRMFLTAMKEPKTVLGNALKQIKAAGASWLVDEQNSEVVLKNLSNTTTLVNIVRELSSETENSELTQVRAVDITKDVYSLVAVNLDDVKKRVEFDVSEELFITCNRKQMMHTLLTLIRAFMTSKQESLSVSFRQIADHLELSASGTFNLRETDPEMIVLQGYMKNHGGTLSFNAKQTSAEALVFRWPQQHHLKQVA